MKYLAAFLLCIVSFQNVHAQSISLFGIDASGFPTIKAKFYAFDAAGKQVRPNSSELSIFENGKPRMITTVNCSPAPPPKVLSSVLVVDISASMSSGQGSTPNIELAKDIANTWVSASVLGISECAITSFDHANYLNQDFTADRSKLLNAITSITPQGGTDYDAGFINPMAGGLRISKNGKFQKVIVFLTDGQPFQDPQTDLIISEANKQNCIIYCITLGLPAPQSIKKIASQTGGKCFENINSVQGAKDVCNTILNEVQGGLPCDLIWRSGASCDSDHTQIDLTWNSSISYGLYTPPSSAVALLKVSPSYVALGKVLPSSTIDTSITFTAMNADFTITDVQLKYGSTVFSVVNTSFPIIIPQNTSKSITLRCKPIDSSLSFGSFEVITDLCSAYFSVSSGFPDKRIKNPTLKVTYPNGGETFGVGSDTLIKWDGISKSDTVELEYSIDNGSTWISLTTKASNLQYAWKSIPKPVSNVCKIRIKQKVSGRSESALKPGTLQFDLTNNGREIISTCWSPDGSKVATASSDGTAIVSSAISGAKLFTLSGHTNVVFAVRWSPDGQKIATASGDNTAIIWSALNGQKLFTLNGHADFVYDITWSPDGTKVATSSRDNTAIIWSVVTGTRLFTLSGHSFYVSAVKWSPDGTKVVTASDDYTAIIWSVTNGTKLFTLRGHTGSLTAVSWSSDGTRVATASKDSTAIIWLTANGSMLFTLKGHTHVVSSVYWSPDGTKVVTASWDNKAIIWSATNGAILFTLLGHTSLIYDVSWSPDGMRIATAGQDRTAIIWSESSGTKLLTLSGHLLPILTISWSPDGTKVISGGMHPTAKIWYIGAVPLQEDESDSVFSIVMPPLASQDIDMKQYLVGSAKDSVIQTFVQNIGIYPFRVDAIAITGADASQFSLVSGIPPFDVPAGKTHGVEFRFRPTSVGVKTAQLRIFTQADTLRQTIRGEGIAPALRVVGDVIDFGAVEVGTQKDTLRVITIKNIGTAPLTITSTRHAGPNDVDFSTLSGSGNFTLAQGDTARFDLRFLPKDIGRTSGRLLFEYNGVGSPATVQLFGEGTSNRSDTARMTVVAQDITAQAGEKVNLILKVEKQTGMQVAGAPTDWYASVHYNKSMLFNEQSQNVCAGTEDSCVLELTGTYNPKTDELISIPCIATLGTTDNSMIIIDDFRWLNSSIITETQTQNGKITITGACEEGGVRLYIPGTQETSLTTRPNPAQNSLQVQYGVREPLTLTLELLNMTGQVVQTIFRDQQKTVGQYLLTSDLSAIGNGIYILRLTSNRGVLTTRVDVVK